MNRFFNTLVNKICGILIVIMLMLFAFFLGLWKADALTASQFGNYLENRIDELTSISEYIYDAYNSDTIKDNIFKWSNEKFFENTYTEEEFFSHYSYVIQAYNVTTIRVFVQDYARVMDYQGLSPIEGQPIKFFFANMTLQYQEGLYRQYYGGVSAIYSYYIDINYNSMSYTFSNNNPLTDLNFYSLNNSSAWFANINDRTYLNLNMKLFDSFNGNFAWIENWADSYNTTTLWNQVAGTTPPKSAIYYNSPIEFPTLQYMSSGTDPGTGSGSGSGTDLSGIEDKIDQTNGILEGIGGTIGKIGESIGNGLNDLIKGILDTLNDVWEWLTKPGDFSSIEKFFKDFSDSDVGGISGIVSLPLDLIRSLVGEGTCSPLVLPIWGKEIEVPSGCIMWEQASDEIVTIWHTIICGLGSYYILVDLFKTTEKLKEPQDLEVNTLDL